MTTPERQRLAAALRGLRSDAGLSTTKLAERLGWSQSKVSKTELGRTAPPPADVAAWAVATGATSELREELVALAAVAEQQTTEWRRELAPGRVRLQRDIERLEAAASCIRVFSHDVIPGLAQTAAYAAAMFQLGRRLGPDGEVPADVVEARIARQAVLDDTAKTFHLVMSETAVRRRLIASDRMVEQLHHLLNLQERPNVTIAVIPFNAREVVHQYHGFAILGDPRGGDQALVLAETLTRGLRIRAADEVADYLTHFDQLRETALEGQALHTWLLEIIAQTTSS